MNPHRYDPSPPAPKVEPSAVDLFHAHLDKCNRCASSPFNLCPKGIELISVIINENRKPAKKGAL